MSLYKLIEVTKTEEKETQSIYDFENLDPAVTKMHNDFGSSLKQEGTLSAYCIVMNNGTGYAEATCVYPMISIFDEAMERYKIRERIYTHNNYMSDNLAGYDTEQLAVGNFHSKIASARSNPNCTYALTIRINSFGECVDRNQFIKETN